jgi:hypothetical protein
MAWPGWATFRLPTSGAPAHNYHARAKEVDGHWFPSTREADRYLELRLLERGGEIQELRLQVRFPLLVGEIQIGSWLADFTYREAGRLVVEDAKGMRLPLYRWKRKHVEAQYGIRIREV